MTTNEFSRLDRLEALAETTLRSIAELSQAQDRSQERFDQQFDRIQQQIDANAVGLAEVRQLTESNARAIEANSISIAESRRETDAVREDLRNATQMIIDLGDFFGEQFDRIKRQFEQDRTERLALSADVRSLVVTLRERFGGNGHSGSQL